jgi:hypothetical protein
MTKPTIPMVGLSLVMVLAGSLSYAAEAPIAAASLYGVWEGIELYEPRIIVMSLEKSNCVIVMTAGAPNRVVQTIFKSRDFSVGADGTLTLLAESADRERLRVHGKPKMRGADGVLEADVQYWPAGTKEDAQPPDRFYFQRRGAGYLNRLRALGDAALESICENINRNKKNELSEVREACARPDKRGARKVR